MNSTIERINQFEAVPEERQILFGEVSELMKFAEGNSIAEAIAAAFKYGFTIGREYEREN